MEKITHATSPKSKDNKLDGVMLTMRNDRSAGVSLVDIEKNELQTKLEELAGSADENGNARIGKNLHENQQFV